MRDEPPLPGHQPWWDRVLEHLAWSWWFWTLILPGALWPFGDDDE